MYVHIMLVTELLHSNNVMFLTCVASTSAITSPTANSAPVGVIVGVILLIISIAVLATLLGLLIKK